MVKRLIVIVSSSLISTTAVILLLFLMKTGLGTVFRPAFASPHSPTVTAVDPGTAPNDLDTPIVITGTGFTAVPTVTLGSTLLEDINWVNADRLTATVPWGMQPGVYALTVENPGGEMGSLTDAFTVTHGIGVWTTGGPYGGEVIRLVMNTVTPTTLYALAHNAGIFASYDAAESWEPILLDNTPILLAVDAGDSQVMYFGSACCLLRTEDSGESWESIEPPGYDREFYPAAHPEKTGIIYAGLGTQPGVLRSDDYGDSWIAVTEGISNAFITSLAFHPEDPDKMLAGSSDGNVFLSTDGGGTWDWKAKVDAHIEQVYFNPYGAHEAWAITEVLFGTNVYPDAYLYKSVDSGLGVWSAVDVHEGNVVRSLTFLTDTIWAAGAEGFTSTNGGTSWYPVRTDLDPGWNEDTHDFAIDPGNPAVIYAGSLGQGMFKSSDGGSTWVGVNEGLAAVVPLGLAVAPADLDTLYADTYALGILKSSSGGHTWKSLGIGKGGFRKPLAVDPVLPSRVYMGDGDSGQIRFQISEDAGDTWHEVTETLPVKWSGWDADILKIVPHPTISGTILAGARFLRSLAQVDERTERGAIYISADYGEHWEFAGPTQPISGIFELAYDAVNPNLTYAGTSNTGLWKSTDGGASWGAVTSFPGGPKIFSIAAHPNIPDTVYVRCDYLEMPTYVSRDTGESWEQLPPCENCGGHLLFAPPGRGKPDYTLYAGPWMPHGLYSSKDGGYNWEQVDGVPTTDIYSLAAGSDDERVVVYVGISGGVISPPPQMAAASAVLPDRNMIMPGGVYRWGNWLNPPLYFPLILKSSAR